PRGKILSTPSRYRTQSAPLRICSAVSGSEMNNRPPSSAAPPESTSRLSSVSGAAFAGEKRISDCRRSLAVISPWKAAARLRPSPSPLLLGRPGKPKEPPIAPGRPDVAADVAPPSGKPPLAPDAPSTPTSVLGLSPKEPRRLTRPRFPPSLVSRLGRGDGSGWASSQSSNLRQKDVYE